MENSDEKRIKELLKDMYILQSKENCKIERMSKYVSKMNKRVFVCLHPSATVHYYHTHDFFEINYVYEGDCINMIEGESLHMDTGDFLMLHPGTFHTVYSDAQSKVVNILVQPAFINQTFLTVEGIEESSLAQFINRAGNNSYYKYVLNEAESVRQEIISLMIEELEGSINSDIIQESLLSLLICRLMRTTEKAVLSDMRGASSNIIIDMLQYMYDNYNNVTLSSLSAKFGYSIAHISRMFTKQTGKTFGNTLTEIRMEKAVDYLRNTKWKVYEIAQMTGYESTEYFHRLFKSRYGVTPFQFRESCL